MKRNQFLDCAKGLLILLVTIGHALQFVVYQKGEGFWADPVFKAIYVFHMPLFMGISGYLAYSGIQRLRFLEFTLGKLKTYLVPVLAWAATYTLAKCLIEGWPGAYGLAEGLAGEFLGINLWFIWVLFGCLILTAAIKTIGRWFWMIYAVSSLAVLFLPEVGNLIVLKFMYPYFQVGYALAHFGTAGIMRFRKSIVGVAVLLSVLGYSLWTKETYIYISGMELTDGNLANVGLRYLTGFSASVVAVFLFKAMHQRLGGFQCDRISSLGRDSIFIYIIQVYFFSVLSRVVSKIHGPIDNFWLGLLVALVIGVVIALLCLFAGRTMSRSRVLAALYFGKYPRKPRPDAGIGSDQREA